MKQNSTLLDNVIYRVFKNHDMFKLLKQNYSQSKTHYLLNQSQKISGSISLFQLITYSVPLKQLLLSDKGNAIITSFNLLLWDVFKNFIQYYLVNNQLFTKFEKELLNTVFSHQSKNLSDYIHNIQYHSNPIDFFTNAFLWEDTTDGYWFWTNVNLKYKSFIFNILQT